jgi:hypothetical protein
MAMPELPADPIRDLIPLSDFRRLFKRPPSTVTIYNWRTKGVLNRDTGKRVKLPTIKTPQGRATSMTLYQAFLRELNSE